jgi:hypothetical protein
MTPSRRVAAGASLALAAAAAFATVALRAQQGPAESAALGRSGARALIIGGGPDRAHNQVAIESNVRYVSRVLPPATAYQVLFTDGNPQSETVQYQGQGRTLAYRGPNLPRLDAGADTEAVRTALVTTVDAARSAPSSDVLLYFTGHGTGDRRTSFANNWFDLWNGGRLTVRDLAEVIGALPAETPITLIMVQCYSGAFGNVLFRGGDPQGDLLDRHIAGFFAALPDRTAAGCTPAINEADYKDFTGYFFAALTGEDRMGRPVSGADYDADGRVGMNEAFAWALVHDASIDTPVCTSDTFLRRFAHVPDEDVAGTPLATLASWATPAQRAALEGLSRAVGVTGDDQLRAAFDRFTQLRPNSQAMADVRLIRFVNLARSVAQAHAIRASGDESAKRRLAELEAAEARNPLR